MIETIEQLEALYGTPKAPSLVKVTDHVTAEYGAYIKAAPFVALSTVGAAYAADPVKVGLVAALSGQSAKSGEAITRGLTAAIEDARKMGIKRLFTLTYEQGFFERLGFEIIDRHDLPEKVWRECLACPKAEACDEIAMMLVLK